MQMTLKLAIKRLANEADKHATRAMQSGDPGVKFAGFSAASVLCRVQSDLSDCGKDAVGIAFASASRMETADRDLIPSDIWVWMRQHNNA